MTLSSLEGRFHRRPTTHAPLPAWSPTRPSTRCSTRRPTAIPACIPAHQPRAHWRVHTRQAAYTPTLPDKCLSETIRLQYCFMFGLDRPSVLCPWHRFIGFVILVIYGLARGVVLLVERGVGSAAVSSKDSFYAFPEGHFRFGGV